MDLNKVYRMLEINSCGVTDVKELAEESGLTQHIVTAVLGGQKYRAVVEEFKVDNAKGKTRVYPVPEPVKLKNETYHSTRERYLIKLIKGSKTVDEIRSYLIIDNVETKQANKLIEDLTEALQEHKQLEIETTLDRIDEILNRPKKWAIVNNELVEVKPVPILEGVTVVGMEYRESGSFYLPEELYNHYISYVYQVKKFLRGDSDHDLTATERANICLAAKFQELREKGYSNAYIANLYEIKKQMVSSTIGYLTGKAKRFDTEYRENTEQRALLLRLKAKHKAEAAAEIRRKAKRKAEAKRMSQIERGKQMYELRESSGLSIKEIAKEFDISPTTVSKRLALYKRYLAEQAEAEQFENSVK